VIFIEALLLLVIVVVEVMVRVIVAILDAVVLATIAGRMVCSVVKKARVNAAKPTRMVRYLMPKRVEGGVLSVSVDCEDMEKKEDGRGHLY
jgi:hypothetical protein